jgi:hypothetical protein
MERTMFTSHGVFSPVQLIGPLGVLVVGLAFWGWMYRDMVTNNDLSSDEKQNWTFAFILLNIFGALLYCLNVYRNQR